MKDEIAILKSLVNKMQIERLVLESLKHEELTEDFINQFVITMNEIYDKDINLLKNIIERIEKEDGEDGK